MRIVQMIETLEVGGMERIAVDLALAQHDAGHHTAVYCLLGAGPLQAELDRAGVPVAVFQKRHRSKASVIGSMAAQFRRFRPHIVHGHNPGVHHFAAVAARLAGVPVCLNTRHSVDSSTGAPYQERYFRWVEPLTNHVVFVCDYVRNELEPRLRYPAKKCSVILNGVPLERFLAHPASPGSASPRIRFGTIGRLVPAKGHAVLIDAFSRVAGQLTDADLRIFGYGPLGQDLQMQIQRLGMSGRIRLEGRTEDPALALQSLDIFVFASLHEGLPLVILEAMAAGLPVVSTRIGGVPEVAPASLFPWFCAPGSAPALADVMLQAARSDRLPPIGAEARRLAAMHYGIGQMSRSYETLYERLLSRS